MKRTLLTKEKLTEILVFLQITGAPSEYLLIYNELMRRHLNQLERIRRANTNRTSQKQEEYSINLLKKKLQPLTKEERLIWLQKSKSQVAKYVLTQYLFNEDFFND